ncbi:MAG TPA: TetR/AcrR family transcriptional regulator [Acidimicrobiales bacterium]|nr:TetR/AcrR family transcriptional regulator [Acidimicrobiales bacterium]
MPTGFAMRDPRTQLFDAAERILQRDGPGGLTSRAVTTEATCAKGVLHRHFADFDAFLAEFVLDRAARVESQATILCGSAGTGTVAGNLTGALVVLFGPVAVTVVSLVISRDGLRARLRQAGVAGVPILTEAVAMLGSYLTLERDMGRIAADADIGTLAPTLVGAVHILFTDREGPPVRESAVHRVVTTVIASALRDAER